jgi:putative acetyltransferase
MTVAPTPNGGFQKNMPSVRFYTRRGFHRVKLSDGSGNEEREPDALY